RALLIEQKVRDDHDSSKRRGQWENFERKVQELFSEHGDKLMAVFYFIDPSLRKNRNFYTDNISKLRERWGLDSIFLCYGDELFVRLGIEQSWDMLVAWLKKWKNSIPVMPDVSWETEEAIKDLKEHARKEPRMWLKLAHTSSLWEQGIINVLFPTGKGLLEIAEALSKQQNELARRAGKSLLERTRNLGTAH
ncbi:MAG: hypothetical protein ACK4G4_06715, partial [Thermus sp.]|uniref:hypothetical protein n=1 Tax=Thermus sp. TaxID=275 RepID=UPI00391C8B8F